MIVLQARDKEILKVCYEQQFILTEHVSDHFFGGSYTEALRRVIELRKWDYLQNAGFKIGKKMAHILGHRGMPVAEASSAVKFNHYPRIDPKTAEHDAIVTDVRLRLASLWDGGWIPERGIRSFDASQVPDGLFLFENGRQVAVEVENSLKGRTRFVNRLKFWGASEVAVVLFVATSHELYTAIESYLAESPDSPICCLTTYDSLRSDSPAVWSKEGALGLFAQRVLP